MLHVFQAWCSYCSQFPTDSRTTPLIVWKLCFKLCDSLLSHQVLFFFFFFLPFVYSSLKVCLMRKHGCKCISAKTCPAFSEAWVCLLMCCGTVSNTVVALVLSVRSVGSCQSSTNMYISIYVIEYLWICFSCWLSKKTPLTARKRTAIGSGPSYLRRMKWFIMLFSEF